MSVVARNRRAWTFEDFTLDLDRGCLRRAGIDIKLRPKSYAVLSYLVERHGQLVTKEELLNAIWGHTAVTEGTLTQCLMDIRRALGDASQQMIRTVPRRGYLFDVPVAEPGGGEPLKDETPPIPEQTLPRQSWRQRRTGWSFLVAILAVAAVGVWWSETDRNTVRPVVDEPPPLFAPENSIAVLPFTDLSPEHDQDYFSDGVSEEILNKLSGFRELRVIARTSSFSFKGSGYDIPRLSSLLGVRYLLQGSVRKDGHALRISAQLVDSSGRQLWSESFDRELTGIFAIQTEIADTVAARIVPRVAPRPAPDEPPDVEAHQHYLIGREILSRRMFSSYDRAVREFDLAIEIDPDFAEAYAERAIALSMGRVRVSPQDRNRQLERAAQDIRTAMSLKPNLARAYAAEGLIMEETAWFDFEERERLLRRALAIDPGMVDGMNWLAGTLDDAGRLAEAYEVLERAARIDPLAPVIIANLARQDVEMGATAKAESRLRQLLQAPRPSELVYHQLWELYSESGRLVEAIDMAKRFALSSALASGRPLLRPLIESYQSLGLWEKAERWLSLDEGLVVGHEPLHARYLISQGRFREAVTHYGAALQSEGADLAKLPSRQAIAYGILQTWAGDHDGAIHTLEPLREGQVKRGVAFDIDEVDALQHLAWAWQETGAPDRAAEILDALEVGFLHWQAIGRLHRSTMLFAFAENARLSGSAPADRLRKAIEAGWRGYYLTPAWHPYVNDTADASMMAAVKSDVDAQRAEVLRHDAEDDFAERLESTIVNAAPR